MLCQDISMHILLHNIYHIVKFIDKTNNYIHCTTLLDQKENHFMADFYIGEVVVRAHIEVCVILSYSAVRCDINFSLLFNFKSGSYISGSYIPFQTSYIYAYACIHT